MENQQALHNLVLEDNLAKPYISDGMARWRHFQRIVRAYEEEKGGGVGRKRGKEEEQAEQEQEQGEREQSSPSVAVLAMVFVAPRWSYDATLEDLLKHLSSVDIRGRLEKSASGLRAGESALYPTAPILTSRTSLANLLFLVS